MTRTTWAIGLIFAIAAAIAYGASTRDPVTVCHRPPGQTEAAHTISVDNNAVPAHLAHGDLLGPCAISPSR